jgi:hypothetical protein
VIDLLVIIWNLGFAHWNLAYCVLRYYQQTW